MSVTIIKKKGFFFFFFWQAKGKNALIYTGSIHRSPKVQKSKHKQPNPCPQKESLIGIAMTSYNICLTKILSTFFTLSAQVKREWMRAKIILFAEKESLSNIILFFSFYMAHKRKRGAALQKALTIFPARKEFYLVRKSLTLKGTPRAPHWC